jgi:hypothetical protein
VSLASEADDAEICGLLASAAFPGDVQVSLERAPSPTAAGAIDGDVHQLIAARDRRTGALLGVASRSERDLYLNGRRARAGYLGQLRVDRSVGAWRALLDAGFAFCRELHDRGEAPFYLTSVVADNAAARRLLVGRVVRSAPVFLPIGRLRTFAIPSRAGRPSAGWTGRRWPAPPSEIRPATVEMMGEIVACLHRNLPRYQFAPHWTAADFRAGRLPGLRPRHFVVALRDGCVVGCLARWDQTAFKQVVIRGYSRRLARWRPIVNAVGSWWGVPRLPPVGAALRFAFLSHAAVDDDREDVFAALVDAQCRLARADGADYVAAAFAPDHPFHAVLSDRFRSRTYDSVIYLGGWSDPRRTAGQLDGRPLQPEVALL